MASAGTPVTLAACASVYGSTASRYASNPVVARAMKARFSRPAARISRPMALARAMSEPTSIPSHPSAHRSEEHTSELQSHHDLVCRLLLEKKKHKTILDQHRSPDHDRIDY